MYINSQQAEALAQWANANTTGFGRFFDDAMSVAKEIAERRSAVPVDRICRDPSPADFATKWLTNGQLTAFAMRWQTAKHCSRCSTMPTNPTQILGDGDGETTADCPDAVTG